MGKHNRKRHNGQNVHRPLYTERCVRIKDKEASQVPHAILEFSSLQNRNANVRVHSGHEMRSRVACDMKMAYVCARWGSGGTIESCA